MESWQLDTDKSSLVAAELISFILQHSLQQLQQKDGLPKKQADAASRCLRDTIDTIGTIELDETMVHTVHSIVASDEKSRRYGLAQKEKHLQCSFQ